MGAWIETCLLIFRISGHMSHPVWVRGLKPSTKIFISMFFRSHPVWVRGLKQFYAISEPYREVVAPRVGAWIETLSLV